MCNPLDFGWLPFSNGQYYKGLAVLRPSSRYPGDWRLVYPDGDSRLVLDCALGQMTREVEMFLEIDEMGEVFDEET